MIRIQEPDIKLKKIYWLLGRKSKLSIDNKLLLYNQILKHIGTYAIQLWGSVTKSNIQVIQRFQNKAIRDIFDALPKQRHPSGFTNGLHRTNNY